MKSHVSALLCRGSLILLFTSISCEYSGESPDPIEQNWFTQDFRCGEDGLANVEIPAGRPLILQVYGYTHEDEGLLNWWLYDSIPVFTPGDVLQIPCEEDDRGRVVYAYE